MLHKIQTFNPTLDFANNPIQIRSGSPVTRNINAVSTGRSIGNSGTRLWDTNLIPASSTQLITPASPLNLPFVNTSLPGFFFDSIIVVNVDGQRLPIAISNAPDNAIYSSNQAVDNKKLFWLNLRCFLLNNAFGSNTNSVANHYMFGGQSGQGGGISDFVISFAEPITAPVTLTYKIQYYRYTGGLLHTISSSAGLGVTGQLDYTFLSVNLDAATYNATGVSFYSTPGYWKISLSINSDSYRSLLPFYHWGCAS
jgi:hypothetical protein